MSSTTSSLNSSATRSTKRMRNGTRSCTECRRRKVRCIFEPNSQICKECLSHDALCRPQQPRPKEGPPPAMSGDVPERLEHLEGMLRRLGDAVVPGFSSQNMLNAKTDDFGLESHRPPPRHIPGAPRSGAEVSPQSTKKVSCSAQNASLSRSEEPLVNFMHDGLPMRIQKIQDDAEETGLSTLPVLGNSSYIEAVLSYVPNIVAMSSILEATRSNWRKWQTLPDEFFAPSPCSKLAISHARNFIFQSLAAPEPEVVARALLCLAVCIQQLPRDFYVQPLDLMAPLERLQDLFTSAAETLISNDSSITNLIGLDCLMLVAKLCIHLGKPRKTWSVNRRAATIGLLLRLHHSNSVEGPRGEMIWSKIWQRDRQYSMILGLPHFLNDLYIPPPVHGNEEAQRASRMMRTISIISGKVIERDFNIDHISYTITLQLAEELERAKSEMSPTWWQSVPNPNLPVDVLHNHFVIKMYYHYLRKHLHLPYVIKSFSDSQYEISRIAALESAKAMMVIYPFYLTSSGFAMCELVDFQIFAAALLVVICLLNCSKSNLRNIAQEARDWEMVDDITIALQSLSRSLECTVASQAASLLVKLAQAREVNMEGPTYSTVVPYFGRFRISKDVLVDAAQARSSSIGMPQDATINTVEFEADPLVFPDAPQSDTPWSWSNAELGTDWTAAINPDQDYTWNWQYNNMAE